MKGIQALIWEMNRGDSGCELIFKISSTLLVYDPETINGETNRRSILMSGERHIMSRLKKPAGE